MEKQRISFYNPINRKEVIKMTKKQAKEKAKQSRVLVSFNTGTRTMKSAKYPTRQERKRIREEI